LGLLLMTLRLRDVALQLTTFALAQTAGFALMNSGIMAATGRGVWPVIALSIAYVMIEGLLTRELTRWRLVFICVFGLFHGAQLASAFSELGPPPAQFAAASAAFAAVVLGAEAGAMGFALLTASAIKHRQPILNSEFLNF